MCPYKNGHYVSSNTTGPRLLVKLTADCGTSNVVYLIECKRHAMIHCVGETENALRVQLTGHQSDIKHKKIENSVDEYCSLLDHYMDDLQMMVIEKIHREDSD